MISATNRQLGVEPFKTHDIQTVNVGGFAKIGQKHTLTALKVVVGNNNYKVGNTIYVSGEMCKAPWANKIYKVKELEFILIPEDTVLLVEE